MTNKVKYRLKVHGNKKEKYVYAYLPTEYAIAIDLRKGDWIEWEVDMDDLSKVILRKLETDEEWPDRRVMERD